VSMIDKRLGWAALACLVGSAVPFWLWKLFIVTGSAVRILIRLFVGLFGLSLLLGFGLGCRGICRTTRSRAGRALLIAGLLGGEAYAALMAALAMNFVGQ
jgi:hypothetical protein